jgi:hypothetical protein
LSGLKFDKFVEEDKELLKRGSFVWGEEADDFLPGLTVTHVKLSFDPGLESRELLLL